MSEIKRQNLHSYLGISLYSPHFRVFYQKEYPSHTCLSRANHPLQRFFNAQQAYNEALANQVENLSDNYYKLLPFYPLETIQGKTTPGGPFDGVIDKTTKAIREHSISTKPRRISSKRYSKEQLQWFRQEEYNPL